MPLFVRHRPPPGPFCGLQTLQAFPPAGFSISMCLLQYLGGLSEGCRHLWRGSFSAPDPVPGTRCSLCESVLLILLLCELQFDQGQRFPDEHLLKAGICYVDPCSVDPFLRDLFEKRGGLLSGLTSSGRFTSDVIRLNREECRRFRFRRQQSAERITRLRSVVAALDPNDDGSRLAADALLAAQAEWDECYGSYPRMPPAE